MNKSIIYLLGLFMMGSGLTVQADQQQEKEPRSMFGFESSKATEQPYAAAIKKALKSFSPGLKPDSIKPIAAHQFYEVMIGTEVVYISQDGRYMLQGDLVDIEQRVNLSRTFEINCWPR